ncbi:MAG TPA: FAD synthetase family protein [Acidimicrobiales bacterium]
MSQAGADRPSRGTSIVTIGTYDGVHLGHQRLIAEALTEARDVGLPVVVVTFDRLPAEVLHPSATLKLLTGLEHRLELLEATKVDALRVLHFDLERAAESAESFIEGYVVGELGAASIYVGANFRFGNKAMGDIELLERLAPRFGYSAHGVELLLDETTNRVVSSSQIREFVAAGELSEAARLLGRPHEVRGSLVPDRRGVVVPGAFALPPAGRYVVEVGAPREPGVKSTARLLAVGGSAAEVLLSVDKLEGPLADARPGSAIAVRFS